jgi:hypothetical protein
MDSPYPGMDGSIIKNFSNFVDSFDMSDDIQCTDMFSSLLELSIPALHYPDEYILQSLLFLLLNMTSFRARREPYLGDGRPDIVYDSPSGSSTIVEIKFIKPKHPEKVKKMTKPLAHGSSVTVSRKLPETIRKILEKGIDDAVNQILARKYINPFYNKRKTSICAVSVFGWSYCMFRFHNVNWIDKTVQEPIANKNSKKQPEK